MSQKKTGNEPTLVTLNRTLVKALLALGSVDPERNHMACQFAATAYVTLRDEFPRESERLNGVLHSLTKTTHTMIQEKIMSKDNILDVRSLIPMERHRRIFETYNTLKAGDSFILVNDHDPKPLYYQFEAEHNGEFSWKYVESGPATWQVEIGRVA